MINGVDSRSQACQVGTLSSGKRSALGRVVLVFDALAPESILKILRSPERNVASDIEVSSFGLSREIDKQSS